MKSKSFLNNDCFKKIFTTILLIYQKVVKFLKKVFLDKKKTGCILFVFLLLVCFTVHYISSHYYDCFYIVGTDDIVQYYPYVGGFFEKLKSGNLSLYDQNLFGGASFFSGVYYIPLDIFTWISFLLSFFMRGEAAYAVINLVKIACGSTILYWALARRNISIRTSVISALILFVSGVTQTFIVFPVFLGVLFYAPLAILLVDLCVDKKGLYYFTIPLYCISVIFMDFYIAYMLIAFMCVYFMISMHMADVYSFFGKNTFIKNKEFYKRFFIFIAMVLLGVLMGAIVLFPSALYILNESSRFDGFMEASKWYFTEKVNGKYVLDKSHYFTYFMSMFITNEPLYLLHPWNTKYQTNHASFYMTAAGAMYFISFFAICRKKENRLKFWVILFNLFFATTIFACIFNLNPKPYSRWFFIPYMINLLAMSYGMDYQKGDFNKNDKFNYLKLVPILFMTLALFTLRFVYNSRTKLFIHYFVIDNNDATRQADANELIEIILKGAMIFVSIYLFFAVLSFITSFFKKFKFRFSSLIPLVIFAEVIFSGIILFSNVDNSSNYQMLCKDDTTAAKNVLLNYGYDESSGYRININTSKAKWMANANVYVGNVNFGSFFQSFYNTPLNTCFDDVFKEPKGWVYTNTDGSWAYTAEDSWSRDITSAYDLLGGSLFNVKYIIAEKQYVNSSPNSGVFASFGAPYKKLEEGQYVYYEVEDMPQFIVYDGFFDTFGNNLSRSVRKELVLNYAYVPKFENEPTLVPDADSIEKSIYKIDLQKYQLYQRYLELEEDGLQKYDFSGGYASVRDYLHGSHFEQTLRKNLGSYNGITDYKIDSHMFELGTPSIFEVYSSNNNVTEKALWIKDTNGSFHPFHYDTLYYDGTWTPDTLVSFANQVNATINLTSYSVDAYNDFVQKQSMYKERYFKMDKDTMHIKVLMPEEDKIRIIKTPYTYSDDWKIREKGYETINVNGGFLGIVVDKNIKNVDITIDYIPRGYNVSCQISIYSGIIYLMLLTIAISICYRQRRRKYEENLDYSSLL